MFDRRAGLACVLIAFVLSPWEGAAAADPPPTPPPKENAKRTTDAEVEADDELLEFLGSVDEEDGELIDAMVKSEGAKSEGNKAQPAAKKVTKDHE